MTFSVERIRHLYDFQSNFLKLNTLDYHYLDEGSGEPVIMLHGNPTWSFMYRELVKSLRNSYRVIVPDHIGCGLSDKPDSADYEYSLRQRVTDLEALTAHLKLDRNLTLVLHDWGGLIGTTFAVRNSSAIKRLVILNTAGFLLPSGKRLHWTIRLCKKSAIAAFVIRRLNAFAIVAGYTGCRQHRLPGEVRRAYKAPYDSWKNRIATLRFVQDIPLTARDQSYAMLEETSRKLYLLRDTPTLVFWGERDFVFDQTFLEEWVSRIPRAEVHRFPCGGHNILEDASGEITPIVKKFLADNPLGSELQ
ncbi:MAG: alpha/beta fold hydrolase [bacterium]